MEYVNLVVRDERARPDAKPILSICANLVVPEAAEVLCLEMEQLAGILGQSQKGYYRANFEDVGQKLDELRAFSALNGLQILEQVAQDVQGCIKCEDQVGLAATMSRLLRLVEQLLTAIWDVQDVIH